MLTALDDTLLGIQSFGVKVARETQQVAGGVDEAQETSVEISQSIEEIATGANRLTEKPTAAGDELTDLSAPIEEFQHALDTLENGGSHRCETLSVAPPAVQSALDEARGVWRPFRANAKTIVQDSKFTDAVAA